MDRNSDSRPRLVLAMIVRDGGQNLVSLLEEAGRWADLIIIGDTGSSDGSAEAAARLGVRVLDVPWTDDFAAARNQVLDACPESWVLVLDADERLAPCDWADLRAWCHRHDPLADAAGLVLATRNYLTGPQRRGWQPVSLPDPHGLPEGPPAPGYVISRKVRLFPARPDIRFRGVLHETVEADLATAGLPLRAGPWPIHHFGMLMANPAKDRRYLELARRKVTEWPRDPRAWAELADCAVACGQDAEALDAAECGLALDPDDPDLGLTTGEMLRRLGRYPEAERVLVRVAEGTRTTRGERAAAAHLRAQTALARDRRDEAGPHLLQALRLDPGDPHVLNTLGVWHLSRGDGARAEQVLRKAATSLPGSAEPRLNLGLLHLRAGRPDKARRWLEGALEVDPVCEKARLALRDLHDDMDEAGTHHDSGSRRR